MNAEKRNRRICVQCILLLKILPLRVATVRMTKYLWYCCAQGDKIFVVLLCTGGQDICGIAQVRMTRYLWCCFGRVSGKSLGTFLAAYLKGEAELSS